MSDGRGAIPTDVAELLTWTSIHGDQMEAILAMEAGRREIERLRAENARMVEALSEIANRSGNDRGADWARGRAKEGLGDG